LDKFRQYNKWREKLRISVGNKRFYGLGQFRIRPTSKEVTIQIHKTMVKSAVGNVTEICCEADGYEKTKYKGKGNTEDDINTRDRTIYMENKK